jgi:ankyrin repeat protein
MIASGAQVDSRDINGRTALFNAVANGHLEVARVLVENCALIDAAEKTGASALHAACAAESHAVPCVQLLLEKGAKVDKRTE